MAAFDFDGTLTRGDTLIPFLRFVCGTMPLAVAITRHSHLLLLARVTGRRRDAAKEALVATLLGGRSADQVRALADRYAETVVRTRLRDDVMPRVAWHQQQGHELVLVSASLDVYLAPICRLLGFDALLSTELEVKANGLLSGRFRGPNVRGMHKAARLRAHLGPQSITLWAYGNDSDDSAMLALATFPTVVSRRRSS